MNEEIKNKEKQLILTTKLQRFVSILGGFSIILIPISIIVGIFNSYAFKISLALLVVIISCSLLDISFENTINRYKFELYSKKDGEFKSDK